MTTPLSSSALRKEIEAVCADGCYGQFNPKAEENLLALIDRERKKAAEEALDRAGKWMGKEGYDFPVPIEPILSDMFPPQA